MTAYKFTHCITCRGEIRYNMYHMSVEAAVKAAKVVVAIMVKESKGTDSPTTKEDYKLHTRAMASAPSKVRTKPAPKAQA